MQNFDVPIWEHWDNMDVTERRAIFMHMNTT